MRVLRVFDPDFLMVAGILSRVLRVLIRVSSRFRGLSRGLSLCFACSNHFSRIGCVFVLTFAHLLADLSRVFADFHSCLGQLPRCEDRRLGPGRDFRLCLRSFVRSHFVQSSGVFARFSLVFSLSLFSLFLTRLVTGGCCCWPSD